MATSTHPYFHGATRLLGRALWALLLLGLVGPAAYAQDLKVERTAGGASPILLGTTDNLEIRVTNDGGVGSFSFIEIDVLLEQEMELTTTNGVSGGGCTLAGNSCSFTRVADQIGRFTFTGVLTNQQLRFQFEVLAIDDTPAPDRTEIEVKTKRFTSSLGLNVEAGTAVQPNFTSIEYEVIAPDARMRRFRATVNGGTTYDHPTPLQVEAGDHVRFLVEVKNRAVATDRVTQLIVQVATPGVRIDLNTPFTSGGAVPCTFPPGVPTCSFDPVSGIWTIPLTLNNNETTQLRFEGTVLPLDYAGAWTAKIIDVQPSDADYSYLHEMILPVTVNKAPVWEKLHSGPFDGTLPDVFVDPVTQRVFIGTDGDGIFFSKDNAANWCTDIEDLTPDKKLPRDFVREITSVDRPASVRFGGRRIIAGTYDVTPANGGRGIYLSDDGGETWIEPTIAPTDTRIQSLITYNTGAAAPNPVGPNREISLAGTADGTFWYSRDDGAQWFKITDDFPDSRILALLHFRGLNMTAFAGQDLVIAGTDRRGILRSTNGGRDWTDITPVGPSFETLDDLLVFDLSFYSPDGMTGTLYAATDDGVYASTDQGTNWTKRPFGPENHQPVMRAVIAYEAAGQEVVIAGGDGGTVYFSLDGGFTWTLSGIGFPNLTLYDFAVDEAGDVYGASGNGGLFRSGNNGQTWIQSQIGLPFVQINALAVDQSGNLDPQNGPQHGDLLAGTYGFGVFHYDRSCGWEPIGGQSHDNRGLVNGMIYALETSPTTNSYFAGTWGASNSFPHSSIFRSDNQGDDWTLMGLPNLNVYDLGIFTDVIGDEVILAGADHGRIFRSVDDGFTWDPFVVANTAVWAVDGIKDSETYLAGTFGHGLFRSDDAGITWTQAGIVNNFVFDLKQNLNTRDHFAATATGIFKSESASAGQVWTALSDPNVVGRDTRALTFFDDGSPDGILYAARWGGGLVKSTDNGASWSDPELGTIQFRAFMDRFWTRIEGDEGAEMEVTYHEVYAIADDGTVYRQRKRVKTEAPATTVDAEDTAELPGDYRLEQNYPNPFNPATTITFDLPETGAVRLAVYDMLGRQVRVLVDGTQTAGTHEVRFDGSGLASGMYLYRLETPGRTLTQRMILMK